MPKMKNHSASKKRFRKTANGKIKHAHAYRRHHAWAKSSKQTRQLRDTHYIDSADVKTIKSLLPY